MLVKLGENGIKTLEDLAAAQRRSLGYVESREPSACAYGRSNGFDLAAAEINDIIMKSA